MVPEPLAQKDVPSARTHQDAVFGASRLVAIAWIVDLFAGPAAWGSAAVEVEGELVW